MAPPSTDEQFIPGVGFFRLGFAGPRRLGAASEDALARSRQLDNGLARVFAGLQLRLAPRQPLVVVGSLAVGADLAIARAALERGAALRALLPEPLDRFGNEEDFPEPANRAELAALAAHSRTCEVRVASSASDRRERFHECAAAVVRESDAVLCVRHWEPSRGRGGTEDTVELCAALGKPLIELRLARDPASPAEVVFPSDWSERAEAVSGPFLLPEPGETLARWKAEASAEAGRAKQSIVQAAGWKVGLQLFSTVIAVLTLGRAEWDVASLLLKTSVILVVVAITVAAARRATAQRWARGRFTAELLRSWAAVRGLPGGASWFEQDLPEEFEALGRDLAVLQGLECAARPVEPAEFAARYARERLASQESYARTASEGAARRERVLTRTFYACLALTLVMLLLKLGLRWAGLVDAWKTLDDVASLLSILGPTFGAAAVSFVALLDFTARSETQSRLVDTLTQQARLLAGARDWSAIRAVVVACERRLLAEVEAWYARHAFRK
jgi:hypothetical protein